MIAPRLRRRKSLGPEKKHLLSCATALNLWRFATFGITNSLKQS
jgi:hypothetical protein